MRVALERLRRVMEESRPGDENPAARGTIANSTGSFERNPTVAAPSAEVADSTPEAVASAARPDQEPGRAGTASPGQNEESIQRQSQNSSQSQPSGRSGQQEGQPGRQSSGQQAEQPGGQTTGESAEPPDNTSPPISRNAGERGNESASAGMAKRAAAAAISGSGSIFPARPSLRRFAGRGRGALARTLRDAGPLLPENSPYRQEIAEIREAMEQPGNTGGRASLRV